MSINISKQKRGDLLNKIKEIRAYISAATQDENTANLLSYLSDLEKDVNGKKYGLVFEEHREEMNDTKKPNPNTNFGYQPNSEQCGYQPLKGINEGYQPTKSISTQPPNKGSNVQQAKNDK